MPFPSGQQLLVELNEAKRSAMIDPLTRVWNRAGMEILLKKEWELAKRKRAPLSVIFFDIDDFKNINDTHGHCAGDDVIRRLSRIIVSSIRSCDSIGRWGGDEFLAVLPLCQVADIMRVAKSIDHAVNSAEVDERFDILRKNPYTMSMGAASLVPDESNSLETLIRNADRAMYKAKRAGKGKFELDARS